ncbi:MAG: VOC family protein [Actinomycetota bacterium]
MADRASHVHGTPSWCDLSSRDLDAAKAFYGAVFGWEMHTAPEPEAGGYTMAMTRGKAAAALMPQQQEQIDMGIPPYWSTYITVDDVDAMPARVEAAGGSVMAAPFDVMTAGRMMVAVDAAGAVFCMWEARDAIGSEVVNETGAYTWAELYTSAPAADAGFYADVLGLTVAAEDIGADEPMTFLRRGEDAVASVLPIMGPEGTPPHWLPYFGVDDCDASVAQIRELGGELHAGPMDIDPGRFAVVTDPEGAAFAVIALTDSSGDT